MAKKDLKAAEEKFIDKVIDDAEALWDVKTGKAPATGRGAKFNGPSARLKLIEQDDEKRTFMAKCIANNLVFFKMGQDPVTNDDELCERLNWFFATCAETQQLPLYEKMANCLGYHRSTLNDWETGIKPGFSPATKLIINQAKQLLASIDAELAQEGKIQPVIYMFRSKNFYGMRDQQEVVVTPSNGGVEAVSIETIEAKYAELPDEE